MGGPLLSNLGRWSLYSDGLILEFRLFDVLGSEAPSPPSEVWQKAKTVVKVHTTMDVARALQVYLNDTLPRVTRQRIEEDAKWLADHPVETRR